MGRPLPIHLTVYRPQTAAGEEALARQTARIQAEAILHRLRSLDCPQEQKQALFQQTLDLLSHDSPSK